MTIDKMYEAIKENVNEIRGKGLEVKYTKKDKLERFNNICKNYSDVAKFMQRRSMPKKAEVERIMKMSIILKNKVNSI